MPYKDEIPITEKQIRKIITKKFKDETIVSIDEIKGSFINPVFDISLANNQNYILRINNPIWPNKQKRELNALAIAQEKTTLPIPSIIISDFSQKIIPYDYMIQEKAPGIELKEAVSTNSLTSDQFKGIIQQLASYLGLLHSIDFDFFGDFSLGIEVLKKQDACPDDRLWGAKYTNWQSCFKALCYDLLNWVDTKSFSELRKPLLKKILDFSTKIPQPRTACFVHSDIQPSNILVNEGKISAILDFEWSYAGSSSFDYALTLAGLYFSNFPSLDENYLLTTYAGITKAQIEKIFLKGYQETYKGEVFSEPDGLLDFIWLLYMIGLWNWSVKSSTKEEVTGFEKDVYALFSRFL